jgi:hypothetical protein
MRQIPTSEETPSESVRELVADFQQRLMSALELVTQEHGNALIEEIFNRVSSEPRTGKERRERKQADRRRREVLAPLTKEFIETIERCTRAQAKHLRTVRERELNAEVGAGRREAAGLVAKPRKRRKPVRPAPPPLDPEQIKRDAETARLRALLKPVDDVVAPAPAPLPIVVPREPVRPSTPGDVLRALEKEIQDAVPTLGTLGPERCAAQIAVWTGRVRELRDQLPPDVAATMRPAFRIFLEHLAQLQAQMEAQVVDALEPTFVAPEWSAYIEANLARVEQRPPRLPDDKLQVFHRTMLRALIQPHRRNANREVLGIIEAAKRALPPNDPQLQSALRRFASVWKAAQGQAAPSENRPGHESAPPSEKQAAAPHASKPIEPANSDDDSLLAPESTSEADSEPASESEFDQAWTK